MSSKINLQTCEYARKSSIFQDNQLIFHTPEHIVVQNGVRMVASVNSFLQEQVYYYEYKNLIFRGSEELGYENYGNGGRDPLEDENRDPRYKHFKE